MIIFVRVVKLIKMKNLLTIAFFTWITICSAQTKLEMTPKGFEPLTMEMPNILMTKLIDQSKAWAPYYNKNGVDVFDVTENSLSIEALIENAYYNYNLGVKYNYDIKYILKIVFGDNQKYTITFIVKDIYIDSVPLKSALADFFTPEGKLKSDYKDVKPSLENTVNNLIKSYTSFIAQ